ncbi:MAG: carotenoid 1,2-hydratase [Planctomycetes bacterium]|nr:carotenoid 1,2-hydratase [Planctomycetota bacterium]
MSDDGTRAFSVIAFIGSVFSPWYAWSGRREPENHICMNAATYGRGGCFAMTDRGRAALKQEPRRLTIGPSAMRWTGDRLEIELRERGAPPAFGGISGRIVVSPSAVTNVELPLSPDGAHIWRPFAPTCSVDVDLQQTGWQWRGHGYFDANFGTRALEQDFLTWTWGRFPGNAGTTCLYDATRRDGSSLSTRLFFDRTGLATSKPALTTKRISRSLWGLPRETRADEAFTPHQVKAMLDTPFYCRSMVRTMIDGKETTGVHEALDLRRFRSPLLKPMLAVRVPRRADWDFD